MLWHDRCVILFAHIVFRLVTDLVSLAIFFFRSRLSVEAENLLLRRQLGLYRERGVKARRVDAVARASLWVNVDRGEPQRESWLPASATGSEGWLCGSIGSSPRRTKTGSI